MRALHGEDLHVRDVKGHRQQDRRTSVLVRIWVSRKEMSSHKAFVEVMASVIISLLVSITFSLKNAQDILCACLP